MKATLRKRTASGGKLALYLDIYPPAPHPITGRLTRKYALGMSIHEKPRTESERQENKQTMALARSVQAKIQLRLQAHDYGFFLRDNKVALFPYIDKIADRAKSNKKQYDRCKELLVERYGEDLSMQFMTPQVLNDFRFWLLERFAQNSASVYFARIMHVLKCAYDENILADDPVRKVRHIPTKRGEVTYLEADDIKKLLETPCSDNDLKNAVVLSISTGLRLCDVEILKGENFFITVEGPEIRIRQKKTKDLLTIPITWDLYRYIDPPETGLVFSRIRTHAYDGTLKKWVETAGITKKFSFHKARHTCAVTLVSNNVNLRTIQALLGHKTINSTIVYAHVVDQAKRDAIEKIKIPLNIKEYPQKNDTINMQ
ncbi:MAG: site-specific integrase [Chlorobiaceae bacterium]|nr:site-specific integrase [Chlorobiaceae bacterium]